MPDYLKEYLHQQTSISDGNLEKVLICFKKIQAKKNQSIGWVFIQC